MRGTWAIGVLMLAGFVGEDTARADDAKLVVWHVSKEKGIVEVPRGAPADLGEVGGWSCIATVKPVVKRADREVEQLEMKCVNAASKVGVRTYVEQARGAPLASSGVLQVYAANADETPIRTLVGAPW